MKKRTYLSLFVYLLCISQLFSQENFKVMFYNVLNYPLQQPATRIDNLETIIEDYLPDLFMICELNNEQGSDAILSMLEGIDSNYEGADFVLNTSDDNQGNQNDLQNMLYFDGSKFILESQTEVTTEYRDFNHYILKLNTTDQVSNPVILNVFVTHLKSSSGSDNQAIRLQMVEDFVAYLDSMPTDSYILLGGDLNFYTSSEDGFEELTDNTNSIVMVDPADRIGSWHNNTTYIDVFTQSTRTQSGLGGATGGFDDRFDFILTSENMITDTTLFYVDDSYQVFGNNEEIDCYNQAINSANCGGEEFDQSIRDALYLMSDHLPVTLTLETSESLNINSYENVSAIQIKGSNVVSYLLNIEIQSPLIHGETLIILNTIGQTIGVFELNNLNELQINVSNFSSGIYYLMVSNKLDIPLKFIKN